MKKPLFAAALVSGCGSFGVSPTSDAEPAPSPGVDAGTYDGSVPLVHGASFCGKVEGAGLLFCDDFDDQGIDRWILADSKPQTVYGVSRVTASPPYAARTEIRAGPDGSPDARLRFDLPGGEPHVEVRGKVRIEEKGSLGDGGYFVAVDYGGGRVSWSATGLRVAVRRDGGSDYFGEKGPPLPAVRVWVSFALEVDLVKSRARLSFDGQEATAVLGGAQAGKNLSLFLGPGELPKTSTPIVVLYDDITVTRLPD